MKKFNFRSLAIGVLVAGLSFPVIANAWHYGYRGYGYGHAYRYGYVGYRVYPRYYHPYRYIGYRYYGPRYYGYRHYGYRRWY